MGIFARIFGPGKKEPEPMKSGHTSSPGAARRTETAKMVAIAGALNARFDVPVEVPNCIDVKAFFSQTPLPYLWPKDQAHRRKVDTNKNPQELLRDQWTGVFLAHPNPDVVLATLGLFDLKGGISSGFGLFAGLLARGEASIAREAARIVWTGNDRMLELTITALGSSGETPSGIEPDEGKRGGGFLRDSCPTSRKATFQKLALEAFGPATAGIPGQLSQPVTLKHGGLKKVKTGHLESVQVYGAVNKLDALRFLESRTISTEPHQLPKENVIVNAYEMTTAQRERALSPKVTYEGVHRFIVETPEGNWGKDNSGIYRIG
jgi:hypothetical protein